MATSETSELKSLDLFSSAILGWGRTQAWAWRHGINLEGEACGAEDAGRRTADQGRARASIDACIRASMHGARQVDDG